MSGETRDGPEAQRPQSEVSPNMAAIEIRDLQSLTNLAISDDSKGVRDAGAVSCRSCVRAIVLGTVREDAWRRPGHDPVWAVTIGPVPDARAAGAVDTASGRRQQ
jgi:hypothetical protein